MKHHKTNASWFHTCRGRADNEAGAIPVTVGEVHERVRTGSYKTDDHGKVKAVVSRIAAEPNKSERSRMKVWLPCWNSANYLRFDLDGLTPEQVWENLPKKHHDKVAFLWKSPSGRGLHGGVRVDGLDVSNYRTNWEWVSKKMGWEDYTDRKSFSEVFFVGHDPDAYLAKKPKVLVAKNADPKPPARIVRGEGSLERDIGLLGCLSPYRYTHGDLIRVIHAFSLKWGKDKRSKEAKEAVRAWCKGMREPYCASKYTYREFERFWREGLTRPEQYQRPVQMGTVGWMAENDNPVKFSLVNAKYPNRDRGQQRPRKP